AVYLPVADHLGVLSLGDLVDAHVIGLRDHNLVLQFLVLALVLGRRRTHLELPRRDENQFHAERVGESIRRLLALRRREQGRQKEQAPERGLQQHERTARFPPPPSLLRDHPPGPKATKKPRR